MGHIPDAEATKNTNLVISDYLLHVDSRRPYIPEVSRQHSELRRYPNINNIVPDYIQRRHH